MKKIYSLICAIAISSIGTAQTQETVNPVKQQLAKHPTYNPAKRTTLNRAKTSVVNAGWFNYGEASKSTFSAPSALSSNYLFPDSTGYGEFGAGNFSACWLHHIAELVDFRSPMFASNASTSWVGTNPTAAFAIDSMSIVYAYTRNHPDPNIVDTLIFTVYDNTVAGNLPSTGGFLTTNFGTADTTSFKRIGYNPTGSFIAIPSATASPQVAPSGQMKFKILLTIADTAVVNYGEKMFALPTAFNSSGGKLVVADMSFKPGYTYSVTEHIDYTANAFFFTSYEENGKGTFMHYLDCNFGSKACDYSQSYIVDKRTQYNLSTNGWNYRYTPAMAYTAPYAYERHLISFHLTDNVVGLNELEHNGSSLGQNVPNPFDGASTVTYKLVKDAGTVNFSVCDVTGRIVSSEKVSAQAGTHTIKLGSYAAGVYYYTLNVDGKTATKKMIAQ
jgi:hypothetical protein